MWWHSCRDASIDYEKRITHDSELLVANEVKMLHKRIRMNRKVAIEYEEMIQNLNVDVRQKKELIKEYRINQDVGDTDSRNWWKKRKEWRRRLEVCARLWM